MTKQEIRQAMRVNTDQVLTLLRGEGYNEEKKEEVRILNEEYNSLLELGRELRKAS